MDLSNNQFTASLWGDEAFSAVLAQRNLSEMIRIVSRDTSPPGYYLCSYLWMRLFGSGEVAIRSLSFAFYLGTVVTVFLLAKHLWGKKTAIIAALLTAFNPFLFTYAFEGRMYAILLFTTALSFFFFIKKQWIPYVFAAAAALYSHHFSIFAIFLQGLWSLREVIQKPLKKLALLLPFVFVFIFYIPWLYPLYYQTSLVKSDFWLGRPDLNSVVNLFKSFVGLNITDEWKNIAFLLTIVTLLLRRWSFDKKSKDLLFALWFALPVALTFIISHLMSSIFFDRYMLYVIPGLVLLLASQRRKLTIVFLISLLLIWFWFDWQYFFNPNKRPFKQLSEHAKVTLEKDDFLINYNGRAHHLWETKYYGLEAPIYSPGGPLPFFVGTAQMKDDDVIYSLEEEERIVVITSNEPEDVKIEGYKINSFKKFDGLWLLWMEKSY